LPGRCAALGRSPPPLHALPGSRHVGFPARLTRVLRPHPRACGPLLRSVQIASVPRRSSSLASKLPTHPPHPAPYGLRRHYAALRKVLHHSTPSPEPTCRLPGTARRLPRIETSNPSCLTPRPYGLRRHDAAKSRLPPSRPPRRRHVGSVAAFTSIPSLPPKRRHAGALQKEGRGAGRTLSLGKIIHHSTSLPGSAVPGSPSSTRCSARTSRLFHLLGSGLSGGAVRPRKSFGGTASIDCKGFLRFCGRFCCKK
jgi:hypothetical protein